jgi:branched-chain amino acid transport system ATP-binding protein
MSAGAPERVAQPRTVAGPALSVSGLTLRFGHVTAFEDVSFTVASGELFAVIGPNGAGKTSLFNVLSRVYQPQAGTVRLGERDLLALRSRQLAGAGVGRTFQNLALFGDLSVLDNVLIGRHHLMSCGPLRCGLRVGRSRREEREHRQAAREVLEFVGIGALAETRASQLPYGLRKRTELARALAMEPSVLRLDEPVAGMSERERAEITDLVKRLHERFAVTILLVEHDMGMVMQIAQRVLVLDFGRVIACDLPAAVQRDPTVVRAYLGEELEVA